MHLPGTFDRPLSLAAIFTVAASLTAPLAQAQTTAEDPPAAGDLPEVRITGSQEGLMADDLPISYDLIDSETLRERQSRTIREAIQNLPNVSIRSTPARLSLSAASSAFARDGNTGINIRGLGGNRVLMTVDGVRMPRSYVSRSAIFDREYLELGMFKGMEIVRGPASALYGSDAIAGVVNFVTYDPEDFLRDDQGKLRPFGGRVSAGYSGDDDGYTLLGTVAGQANDSTQWMLSGTRRSGDGLKNMGNNHEPNSNRTAPNPQNDRHYGLLGKLVYAPNALQKHSFSLEHNEKKSDTDVLSSVAPNPSQSGDVLYEQADFKAKRTRLAWDGRFKLDAAAADNLRTLISYQAASSRRVSVNDLFDGTHRVRDNRYKERAWQVGLRADKVIHSGNWAHRLVYGFEHNRNKITNLFDGQAPLPPETFPLKRFPDTRETHTGIYLQDESIIGDFSFTPGLRLDHYRVKVLSQEAYYPPARQPGQSKSGSHLSPNMGIVYRISDEWSLFGQYAGGWRPPEAGQLNDRFEAFVPPNQNVIIQPNPKLRPEKSRSLELGVRGRAARFSLDASVFSSHFKDLIVDAEAVGAQGNDLLFQSINVPRARIYGFETKGAYNWGYVGPGRLVSSFSYGMARGSNRRDGKPLNAIDPARLTLGARYDTVQWGIWADMRHHWRKKESRIDSTAIMNARSGTQFATPAATVLDVGMQWRPNKNTRFNFAVHNLTNKKYWLWQDVYGLASSSRVKNAWTQPGRSAHASIIFDF